MLSCLCRRRKMAWSQCVVMMPAWLLCPWEVLEMDLQEMKKVSSAGRRYLLVVVDRASRFLFAYPLEFKGSVGVARKLLELMPKLGVPMSTRSDAGGEFTAKVVAHLCQWLNVPLDHDPAVHPRSQGTVERMGGWIHKGGGAELCKRCPGRWDEYVEAACWVQRKTPDSRLISRGTPFRILTNIDGLHPVLDGDSFRTGHENFVAERQQTFRDLIGILERRQEEKNPTRAWHNMGMKKSSSGQQTRVGDRVLMKKSTRKLE